MFVPLGMLPGAVPAQIVWALLNEAALLALLVITLKAVRPDLPARSRRLRALALTAPALLLDPVLLAVRHGQVDIVIALLVAWDLASARKLGKSTVPLGAATGLAAAIKLTPLIFIPYLVLTRRSRAACWCAGTFAAAEAAAFAVAPGVSWAYWTGYVFDYQRIGGSSGLLGLLGTTSQSILAALARLSHAPVPSGPLWAVTGAVAGLGVVLAVRVHARWSPFLGIMLCAITGLLISPVTWTHHMIWVLPAALWLGTSADRPRWGRPAAAFTVVLFWSMPVWWVPDTGAAALRENGWQLVAGNAFFLWMCLLLAACALSLPLRGRQTAPSDAVHILLHCVRWQRQASSPRTWYGSEASSPVAGPRARHLPRPPGPGGSPCGRHPPRCVPSGLPLSFLCCSPSRSMSSATRRWPCSRPSAGSRRCSSPASAGPGATCSSRMPAWPSRAASH
jgi:alpha-1,2-mannosyltransferase